MSSKSGKKELSDTERYRLTIKSIINYYNISKDCALYLYHRVSICPVWNIQLQNALVKLDKCGVDWSGVSLNREDTILKGHGIILNEVAETDIIRHVGAKTISSSVSDEPDNNGWITVKKRNRRSHSRNYDLGLVSGTGLFI